MSNAERDRLANPDEDWTMWGPYVAERAWGTVREDYSANGDAWGFFPYDDARRRTFRWNEDGLAGFSDRHQRWCLAFSFWNGRDDHLKERLFGLSGHEGNHGEDVKEEWWYLDATPSHSWGRMVYAYPQQEFPYQDLREVNGHRSRGEREYELLDTGVFDDGWWDITIDHGKADPLDLCVRVTVTNVGSETDTIHVIPTLWLRNRWRWEVDLGEEPQIIAADHGGLSLHEERSGRLELSATPGATQLFCENETNRQRLWGQPNRLPFTKDGINDHIVEGADSVNESGNGTKAGLWYQHTLAPGESCEVHVRLAPTERPVGDAVTEVLAQRQGEADEFYGELLHRVDHDRRPVARQALAGMVFSRQWYHFDVDRWLEGDPAFDKPPEERLHGRNAGWRHLNNADVIPMPDPWEYPWYAAWDTAFHCLPMAMLDPDSAKHQLSLLGREWFQHPNGQFPAYEWSFSDVNPPVHAWAVLRVFELDGAKDLEFLEHLVHKLLINFTWWVNRRDTDGNNLFYGGFLGLDNIGPFDRSAGLGSGALEQSDATAWMAMYALDLLEISIRLSMERPGYEQLATKFIQHYAYISTAVHQHDLWNDEDGFYYDVFRHPDGDQLLSVRSMVGLIPLFATRVVSQVARRDCGEFGVNLDWFRANKPDLALNMHENEHGDILLSLVSPERLQRLLKIVLDEDEFLSPYGIRGLSKYHADHPYTLDFEDQTFSVGYEPGESESALFGGNSNWRGPVWFPLNYMLIESLRRYDQWAGGSITVEMPTGSGNVVSLGAVADELSDRLSGLFLAGEDGLRPSMPRHPHYDSGGVWHDRLLFHEYFHGDDGRGMGASHQTGWTALVAPLLAKTATPLGRRRRPR